MVALVAAIAASGASAASRAAGPATPFWSESHAETVIVKKLFVPCVNVRSAVGCDLAEAKHELAAFDAQLRACKALPPARAIGCVESMLNVRDPQNNLRWVTHGFTLKTADCVGGGTPDRSGFRFSQLRCKVTLTDQDESGHLIPVTGHLAIYPTGPSTFRWRVI